MENSKLLKTVLFVSGLIAIGVGGLILFTPEILYAASGIELGRNISQLSEVRAPGGALLASGVLIMSGAFIARLAFTSAMVSTVLYLSYGVSRLLSMAIDGMPSDGLVQATVLETAIGLTGAFVLVKCGIPDRTGR
jgi:hypothetical protein